MSELYKQFLGILSASKFQSLLINLYGYVYKIPSIKDVFPWYNESDRQTISHFKPKPLILLCSSLATSTLQTSDVKFHKKVKGSHTGINSCLLHQTNVRRIKSTPTINTDRSKSFGTNKRVKDSDPCLLCGNWTKNWLSFLFVMNPGGTGFSDGSRITGFFLCFLSLLNFFAIWGTFWAIWYLIVTKGHQSGF